MAALSIAEINAERIAVLIAKAIAAFIAALSLEKAFL